MTIMRGPDPYAAAEAALAQLRAQRGRPADFAAALCAALHQTVPTYNWVGYYQLVGQRLRLAVWAGGAAPKQRLLARPTSSAPIVTNDLPRPPASAPAKARAMVVVPSGGDSAVSGALLVASEHRGAFGPADFALLQQAADWLGTPDAAI